MNETLTIALPAAASADEATTTFESREMTTADLPGLVSLWMDSYPPAIVEDSTPQEVLDDWTAAFAGEYGTLNAPASRVVERDGLVIAAVQTVVDALWDDTPRGPFLIEVLVSPPWRRRGVARSLVAEVLTELTVQGFSTASLRVDTDNTAAQLLYRSMGFRPHPTTR